MSLPNLVMAYWHIAFGAESIICCVGRQGIYRQISGLRLHRMRIRYNADMPLPIREIERLIKLVTSRRHHPALAHPVRHRMGGEFAEGRVSGRGVRAGLIILHTDMAS